MSYSLSSTSFVESPSGVRSVSITVTRTDATTVEPMYLQFILAEARGGTASDSDFLFGSEWEQVRGGAPLQRHTFAINETEHTFNFGIVGGDGAEGQETFRITASAFNPSPNGFIQTTGTIDDPVAGAYAVSDVIVTEGDTLSQPGQFVIRRSSLGGGMLGASTINYTIVDNGSSAQTTATFGSDYTASRSGTIAFGVGQTSATVPFTIIGDTTAESNETFELRLSNPNDGGVISRGIGTATIIDNDGTPPPVAPNTPGLQQGTSGGDVLISTNQGNSILAGGRGDDTYLVYSQGDVVIEAPNEGNDILYTTVSYSLGDNQIEAMSVANQMTTNAVNLIGNYVSQIVVGNYGNNVLNGGGGQDTLIGLFGDDTYAVGDSRTVIQERTGQGFDTLVTSVDYRLGAGVSIEVFAAQDRASTTGLRLSGNEFAQLIAGTAGNDTITGGAGIDTLIGGAGADTFVFETSATGNFATLVDFVVGTDRIGLARQAFAALGTTLDASEFVIGTAATAASAQIVYNQATGQLFYDADGTGFFTPTLFAQLAPGTALTAASFDVIVPTAAAA